MGSGLRLQDDFPTAMLMILSGRSGVGKTTVARAPAAKTGAVHLRIDSIEQVLRSCGVTVDSEGYFVAYAVADDKLRPGRTVSPTRSTPGD